MSSFCASPVTISTGVKKTISCKLLYFPSFFCRSISRTSTLGIFTELVLVRAVSSDVPIAANIGLGCLGVAPVFFEHPGWTMRFHTYSDVTLFIRRKFLTIMVDHAHLETW